MNVEETRHLLDNYLEALFGGKDYGQYLAPDVAMRFMDIGDAATGRETVVEAIVTAHTVQFAATFEVVTTVVGAGTAAAEVLFEGTHTAEFGGIPATGAGVRVPYTAFYTMEEGKISEIRVYGLALGIMAQLSAATVSAGASGG
jgi:predicted ester cyclase